MGLGGVVKGVSSDAAPWVGLVDNGSCRVILCVSGAGEESSSTESLSGSGEDSGGGYDGANLRAQPYFTSLSLDLRRAELPSMQHSRVFAFVHDRLEQLPRCVSETIFIDALEVADSRVCAHSPQRGRCHGYTRQARSVERRLSIRANRSIANNALFRLRIERTDQYLRNAIVGLVAQSGQIRSEYCATCIVNQIIASHRVTVGVKGICWLM